MRWSAPVAGSVILGSVIAGAMLLRPDSVYSHNRITTSIVFQKEIARIFQRKCFQCHTEGNISMSLTTYKDARPWAVAIKEEILERRMPPWSAVNGYGHFANDMSLTAREVSIILAWADGGAPSGVLLADESKPPVFVPPLNGWEQGNPDAVVKVATDQKVEAGAPDRTARFEVASGLRQSKWLRALQLNPSDRRVVRYAAIYEAASGRWLGTWTPGTPVNSMPAGVGIKLSAKGKLAVEVGYRGTEEPVSGAAELGLYFVEKRPPRVSTPLEISSAPITVAAGKTREKVRTEIVLKAATTASALWPRLGAGAKSVEVTAIGPDGVVEPLLWLKNYRPEWPSSYVFREPVTLPAGTRLIVTAYYDNATGAALQARPSLSVTAFPPSRPPATLAP
jgi:hypothetical protein